MSMDERMYVAKIILSKLSKGKYKWSDLLKLVLAESPSYSKFNNTLKFLVRNGYVERVSRGVYEITEKGLKFMEAI